jgi:hypothetical protein
VDRGAGHAGAGRGGGGAGLIELPWWGLTLIIVGCLAFGATAGIVTLGLFIGSPDREH